MLEFILTQLAESLWTNKNISKSVRLLVLTLTAGVIALLLLSMGIILITMHAIGGAVLTILLSMPFWIYYVYYFRFILK